MPTKLRAKSVESEGQKLDLNPNRLSSPEELPISLRIQKTDK